MMRVAAGRKPAARIAERPETQARDSGLACVFGRPAIRAAPSAATRILRVSVSPRLSVISATFVISRTRKTAPATLSQW